MQLLDLETLLRDSRPPALRQFDQIPMKTRDLKVQCETMLSQFSGRNLIMIGDYDNTSVVLAFLEKSGYSLPAAITVLDFDESVLFGIERAFGKLGSNIPLTTLLYNVFDPLPEELLGAYDVFYCNPPYGKSNRGESVLAFIRRGILSVHGQGCGYCVIPNDRSRAWTVGNVMRIRHSLAGQSIKLEEFGSVTHGYHLDDDPELHSVTFSMSGVEGRMPQLSNLPLSDAETTHFYGSIAGTSPPHYILQGEVVIQNRPHLVADQGAA